MIRKDFLPVKTIGFSCHIAIVEMVDENRNLKFEKSQFIIQFPADCELPKKGDEVIYFVNCLNTVVLAITNGELSFLREIDLLKH